MNSKEYWGLMEAYAEVYAPEQLDEALTGDRYKKVVKKPGGTAYSRMVSADPKKRAKRGGRGGESDFGAGDRGSGNKASRRAGTYQEYKEELDIFDVVLEFLQAEGYAETLEEAEWLMANKLDSEDIANILEVLDTPEKANEYAKKNVKSMLGAFAKGVVNKDMGQMKTIKKRTEGAKMAKRKAERKAEEEN